MQSRDEGVELEGRIAEWRAYLLRHPGLHPEDVDELEDHLRSRVAELQAAGLRRDEAFLIAVKRLGETDALAREYAREHSERLWKHLVLGDRPEEETARRRETWVAWLCATAAGAAVKAPELAGVHLTDPASVPFYLLNFSLLVLPFLTLFLGWKRRLPPRVWAAVAAPFLVGAIAVNAMPFHPEGDTLRLAAVHLPMALWLALGVAYTGGAWRDPEQRMHFIRFSGEWFIYMALIAMGGGVLMGLTAFVFSAIGVDPEPLLNEWMLPCGVAGAVVIAGWLVEAKQRVIENMAPVLTQLFTPLFALMLLAFLLTMVVTGTGIHVERELLIGFDLLLVLVVGLLVYSISARDSAAAPRIFDGVSLALVLLALAVDAVALSAIVSRISAFGLTPNRVAALGENLILVVNLAGSALLYARFLRRHGTFHALERWQTAFLPVYAGWAWLVVLVFPMVFRFR